MNKIPFDNDIYKIVDNMLSPDEIISENTKYLSLNFFKSQIAALRVSTFNEGIINKIAALEMVLEDVYNIDMYKFQFQVFTEILSKEIKNLQEEISFVS